MNSLLRVCSLLYVFLACVTSNELEGQCSSDNCMAFRVILAGSTGETGSLVLNHLLQDSRVSKVTTLGRRESKIENEKLDHKIVDFDDLPADAFNDHDVAICTLGTTRGKSGKAGFIKVDKDYVLSFADKSKAAGVKQFHMMSSQGAHAESNFLYTQVKGEVDDKILAMGFEKAVVYRPAVLLVSRNESRMAERAAQWFLGWADGGRRMSVKIGDVAAAISSTIFDASISNTILTNQQIMDIALKTEVPPTQE